MPLSNSPLAYREVRAACDRAIANGRGINVACADQGEAFALRQRIYKMRTLDREANAKTYPIGHPLHGLSVYDRLQVSPRAREDGSIVLTILVSSEDALNERIEEL